MAEKGAMLLATSQAPAGFFSRFTAAMPPISKFLSPLRIIPASVRRLRSLWKSKNFRKPFK